MDHPTSLETTRQTHDNPSGRARPAKPALGAQCVSRYDRSFTQPPGCIVAWRLHKAQCFGCALCNCLVVTVRFVALMTELPHPHAAAAHGDVGHVPGARRGDAD